MLMSAIQALGEVIKAFSDSARAAAAEARRAKGKGKLDTKKPSASVPKSSAGTGSGKQVVDRFKELSDKDEAFESDDYVLGLQEAIKGDGAFIDDLQSPEAGPGGNAFAFGKVDGGTPAGLDWDKAEKDMLSVRGLKAEDIDPTSDIVAEVGFEMVPRGGTLNEDPLAGYAAQWKGGKVPADFPTQVGKPVDVNLGGMDVTVRPVYLFRLVGE